MEAIGTFYFSSCAPCVITVLMTTHASGILAPIPWDLLADELSPAFSSTRAARALGTFFLPRSRVRELTGVVEQTLRSTGWATVEWRRVPVCFERFEHGRRQSMPAIM